MKKNSLIYLVIGCILIASHALLFKAGKNHAVERQGEFDAPQGRVVSHSTRSVSDRTASQQLRNSSNRSQSKNLEEEKQERIVGSSVSTSGRLTSKVAEAFSMTREERSKVDQILGRSFQQLSDSVAERSVLDTVRSKLDEGIAVYNVPALADRGQALSAKLEADLVKALGEERGIEFANGFDRSQAFNAFGSCDSTISFNEAKASDPDQRGLIKMFNRDPETGEIFWSYATHFDAFQERFGDSFLAVDGREE